MVKPSIIQPSIIEKWFGDLQEVAFDDSSIHVKKDSSSTTIHFNDLDCYPVVLRGLFSNGLLLHCKGESIRIKGLSKKHRKQETRDLVAAFTPFFENLISSCSHALFERFIRDSHVVPLEHLVKSINASYKKSKSIADKHLRIESKDTLKRLFKAYPLSKHKDRLRQDFEIFSLERKNEFFQIVDSNPLTDEQRLSVIRDNDRNLVLAAAGTGKTTVMVAKALDIIASGLAKPEEVLVLAFGKAAATEVSERIQNRREFLSSSMKLNQSRELSASTFHALGLKILKQTGKNTFISKFSGNEKFKINWLHRKLIEYLKDDPKNLANFITLLYPKSDPLEFESKEDYERFIRDNDYITLNGDRVRSYQELLIGNWLYTNGIDHQYEPNYKANTRIEIGYNYKPDFHITDTNIYIEHYGIDRKGETRKGIDKADYNANIIKKRNLHRENETALIETFHYEWCEKTLFTNLEDKLSELNVKPNPIPQNQIFDKLNNLGMISKFAEIMSQAVSATRVEGLNMEQAEQRLRDASYSNAEEFIPVLDVMKSAYENEMREKGEIDFDDMIIQAVECVRSGEFKPTWKYILVDEFQDISQSRMNLVSGLLDAVPDSSLFAVGDDWQSIYRFTGGKLEITTRFSEIVGSHSLTKLQKTFRYNNSIADIAGRFIMQNPEQYQKNVTTHEKVVTPHVFLIDTTINDDENVGAPESKIARVAKGIIKDDPKGSIAVLARYNSVLADAKEALEQILKSKKVSFWTFHKSKGLEADYCILAGFIQGRFGFPNDNKDHEAVEALLPTLDTYPYSEERRLMYVALTRARKKSFIIADPRAPSLFVNELIVGGYDVVFDSDKFKEKYRKIFKCHNCEDGYLIRKQKFDKPYYACNSYPGCHVITKACPNCSAPMLDNNIRRICKNPDCQEVVNLCPRCYRPLVLRSGRYGSFWGCSGYGAQKPWKCTYTRNSH